MEKAKTIVGVVEDLFFAVKIGDAAKRVGAAVVFVKTIEAVLEALPKSPVLILVDLNLKTIDPIELITHIRDKDRTAPVIGFVSHVQVELRQQAQQAGYDTVLARSAFSEKLPQILRQYTHSANN